MRTSTLSHLPDLCETEVIELAWGKVHPTHRLRQQRARPPHKAPEHLWVEQRRRVLWRSEEGL